MVYDAWTRVLRTVNLRFELTDPPLRHSLPMALSFAATADRPTAVLTGPGVIAGSQPGLIRLPRPMITRDMVLVGLEHHLLTATAAVVWNSWIQARWNARLVGETKTSENEVRAQASVFRWRDGALAARGWSHRTGCAVPAGVRPEC